MQVDFVYYFNPNKNFILDFVLPMKSYDELLEAGELFTDEDDKKRILSLPELQREKILHDRFKKINDSQLSNVLKELDRQDTPREPKRKPMFEECDFILPRDTIISNIFKPSIGILKGCFVRAMINKKYVICKIMAIRAVESYKLLSKVNQMCTIGFDVDNGKKIVEGLQANVISSSGVTVEEFENFLRDFSIESFDDLKKKHKKVQHEFSRSLTGAEVNKTIENKLRDNPKKQTTTERKIEIIAMRDGAMLEKNKEKAKLYQKQLEKIEDEEREERKRKMQEDSEKRKKRARI